MTADGSLNNHLPGSINSNSHQQPIDKPGIAVHKAVENWLGQTSTEYSSSPSDSRKRKRSASTSSQVNCTSPQPSLLESSESDMDSSPDICQHVVTPTQSARSSTPSLKQTPNAFMLDEAKINIPTDQHWIKRRLRTYKCYQDEPGVLEKYPAFKSHILKIINGDRKSSVGPDSAKKYSKMHAIVKSANEDTFLSNILPLLVKQKRTIKKKRTQQAPEATRAAQELQQLQASTELGPDQDVQIDADIVYEMENARGENAQGESAQGESASTQDLKNQHEGMESAPEEVDWVVQDFFDNGVLALKGPDFRRTLLPTKPGKRVVDKALEKAMAKYDGMTNPKPDYIYGTILHHYPVPHDVEISLIVEWLLEVVPLINFPWFLIEGKSYRGTLDEAENQVCRGGAILVNATRLLLHYIGEPEVFEGSKADDRTFVFSAALCPTVMEFRVHWAEVHEEQNTIFHMHVVASENLRDPGAQGKIRRIIHNILDWGCGDRFEDIKQIWDKVYAFERKRVAAEEASASGGGSSASPSKRTKLTK